jgi:hypothetical protein
MLEEEAMEQQGMMPGGGTMPGDVDGGGGCMMSGIGPMYGDGMMPDMSQGQDGGGGFDHRWKIRSSTVKD